MAFCSSTRFYPNKKLFLLHYLKNNYLVFKSPLQSSIYVPYCTSEFYTYFQFNQLKPIPVVDGIGDAVCRSEIANDRRSPASSGLQAFMLSLM